MSERSADSTRAGGSDHLVRGVAVIVVSGIILGLAQNALMRRATPAQGLAWIAEEIELDDLEAHLQGSSNDGNPAQEEGADGAPPAVAPTPVVPDSPFAMAPSIPPDSDLPEIPDLGKPLQMQLPMVERFQSARAALILDVREPEEYRAGHIAGALSLPYDQAITDPERLERLDPAGKPIIVYCGGGTCELSMNMAFALLAAGHSRVLVYMGGFPEWQAAGKPVETGEGRAVR